jgi:hypothetical protein
MAIAIEDATGRRVWGIRYGYVSQESASRGAMDECRSSAKRAGIVADCHLLAVGNQRPAGAVAACADGRASPSFCDLMSNLVPSAP